MESNQQAPEGRKWPGRMALLFTFLFAIFWSLGPFFFWTFLLMAFYFAFLDFYYSDRIQRWMNNFSSAFRPSPQPPPQNPYQSFRSRTATPPPVTPETRARLTKRLVILGFIFFVFITFMIDLFTGVNVPAEQESYTTTTEEPTEAAGTTFWLEKGNAALSDDKKDSAAYYYNQVLTIDPENMYGLYNLGLVHILREDYRKGNGYARRCIQFHPDYNPALWLLGYSYDLTNQSDSALYFLEQAYALDYGQPDFLQLLAEVYTKRGKRSDAVKVYLKLVEQDTTRKDIFNTLAELDPSNANKYLEKVRALEN